MTLRDDLLESDDSMCLGYLMSFKEPEDPLKLIKRTH